MRKLLGFILTLVFLLTSSFAVAAEEGFGTYDKGIISGNYAISRYNPSDGFQNGDFSQGFMFWGTVLKGGPTDEAKLVTENGNTYMQLVPVRDYSGIISVKFICNDFEAGDRAVVIYDWKGSENHQVYLCQVGSKDVRIGNGLGDTIIEASGSGWNTSITKVKDVVFDTTDGNLNHIFYIGLQATTDMTADTCFDNVRLGVLEDDGTVKDLNGNVVGISEQLNTTDEQSNTSEPTEESKLDKTDIKDRTDSKINLDKKEIIVIALSVAVVLFCTFDIVLLVLRKKRKKAKN